MFSPFPNIPIDATVLELVRSFTLLGFLLYLVFAFIAVRQIELMRRTVETPLSAIVRTIGYVHLGLAFLVFFYALTILR